MRDAIGIALLVGFFWAAKPFRFVAVIFFALFLWVLILKAIGVAI